MVDAVKTFDYEKVLKLLNTGVCVKECPSEGVIECKPTTRMTSSALQGNNFDGCVYKLDANYFSAFMSDQATKEAYINKYYPGGYTAYEAANNPYVPFAYESSKLYGFCVPDLNTDAIGALGKETLETFKKLFEETIMNDKMTSYISDIAFSWKVLAICSGTSLVLGYLYLLFIRLCGCVIVWLSIVLIQVSLIGSAVYVYMESENYAEDHDYHNWLKYASYVLAGIAGLFLCCICCCWNAIRIGIAVYQTTAEYISTNLRIFLLPFVTYIIQFVWLGIWLFSFVYVFSIGEPVAREAPYEFLTEVKWEDNTRYMVIYQLFMLFWINAFIVGLCQFIIAASACIWYFEVQSDTGAAGSVGRGIYWGFRFHMGSIAFGAAIIAICQLIRAIFEYYRRKIQSMTKNACVKCLLCYTSYLLWALEKCIKFITKNAYIQVALSNTFFCKAAWNAFSLILKNVHRFGWLNTIGFILNWFGVCACAGLNAFGAYIALTKIETFKENVTQPLAPAIVILLITFFIVKSFLSIFSFSLDAILQSFLLDEALGFSGNSRPDAISKFKTNLEKHAKTSPEIVDDGTVPAEPWEARAYAKP